MTLSQELKQKMIVAAAVTTLSFGINLILRETETAVRNKNKNKK